MRRPLYISLVVLTALAAAAAAVAYLTTDVTSAQATRPRANPGRRTTPARANANSQAGPIRRADPNRAPQPAVDDALYTSEEFFGISSSVTRPYAIALERLGALITQYPKDAALRLHASRVAEKSGQFDRAASEMVQYAELKGRSPDALRRLADFYHNRARFADEVRTLQQLARALPLSDRGPVYRRAALVVRSHSLSEFKPADFFAELVAADPANIQPIKQYVEELQLSKQYGEALAVLARYQPSLTSELSYFLKTRAQIHELMNDRRAAEEVYSSAFDPNWPRAITADYYDLLRRFGRYRAARRSLQERVQSGAYDLQTVGRLFSFFVHEGNYAQAALLLGQLEARRAAGVQPAQPPAVSSNWPARELETVAAMFASIGHYDQASRYLYTYYLAGGLQPGSASREEGLYKLFKVMLDASGSPTRTAGGDLSFYRDVAEVDQHPGFLNGVLSLILTDSDPQQEFAAQEQAAAGYFNRAFAHRIFTSFKQEFAQSKHMAEMYLGVVNVFSSIGEHRLAVEAGREFQTRYPNSPSYAEVSLRMADSYVALKDRVNERSVLVALLDRLARSQPRGVPLVPAASRRWSYGISPRGEQLIDRIKYNLEAYSDTYEPTGDDSEVEEVYDEESESSAPVSPEPGPTYSSVLERYVSSLAAEEKNTETVAFFWGEIRKHPREEGLYERFLGWLGQAQIINEQLKAYNSAIRQFDSNTWHHRLARWYVRQKRGRELARYSRQLIDIFDEEEITEYLLRFAGYGGTAAADGLNWDEKLAFDLYSYAHGRFKRNLFFVRGMLTYLVKQDTARWERLSAEYYFADRSIRDPYLAWLSQKGQLRERYQRAKSQGADPNSQFTYRIFSADAALWLSHHDEAISAYRQLVSLYPGEPQYAERLSDLTRSFGHQDVKFYEESASVLARMAEVYPTEHSYRIEAGEAYAEMGDFARAGQEWDKLVALEPGARESHLRVATVYWDYYQYDQAIRVLKGLREVAKDPAIYAYRLGAVYEGKGDLDTAIAEYVKVLPEPGDGRDTVARRLAQLARRPGLAEKIAVAYERARQASPSDWQLPVGYAAYLSERGMRADALALLRSEVARSSDIAFLETVRDLFRSVLRPEDEEQVLSRLASVGRDERESMMYRLQLASFLERRGRVDDAVKVIEKLVADYPTNVGVTEESAQFYWRAGQRDRSLDLYKGTLARARGPNKRVLTLQLARRQSDAGKLDEAEATLRAYYDENRSDMEVFSELARLLGAANKLAELASLYQSAFADVRGAGLGADQSKERITALREGMIRTLSNLGKHAEAIDQYIEIVNAYPEEAERLAQAYDYAERHNLVERLAGYYEKLTKESFKNYRWQLVLGRIYERRGNLAGAADQYKAAVVNEPQRIDLRLSLASALTGLRRYDEAIATLREGWTLAGRDPQWLIEVARIQVRQGKREEAAQTVRQALAAKKTATAEDQLKAASKLADWGLDAEAVRVYEQVLAALPRTLKEESVNSTQLAGYVRVIVRAEPVAQAFQKIERVRSQYQAIGDNSRDTDGYKAKNIVAAFDQAMRTDFGKGVVDYSNAVESAALDSAIRAATQKMTLYTDRDSLLRYLGIARGANLVEAEERVLIQIKDAAFRARAKPEDGSYYNELRALIAFYNRHAAYGRAAEALAAELARDPYKDRFDYQNQIAIQYRLAGDRARELDSLRSAYSTASGDLTPNQSDWVERYLSLLHESGMRDELGRLASAYSPYQIQLINFLIEKNEKELARRAITSAKQSEAWVASRSAEVGLFLRDASPETESFFKAALDVRPIGEMLGRRVDPTRALVGDDWFVASRNYGYWLSLAGRDSVGTGSGRTPSFLPGEIEGHPSSARAQLELAAYHLDRKDVKRAADHTALASELAPDSKEVYVLRGLTALARNDRKAALDAWNAIIGGRVTVDDAQLYLKVMADNGLLRESLAPIEAFLVGHINQATGGDGRDDRVEAVKPVVRELVNRSRSDARLMGEVAAMLNKAIARMPDDIEVGSMLIEERLLPDAALASVYRTIHRRLSDLAAAVFGTPEYENGYVVGGGYFYPASALSEWRHRFLDYLIRSGSFDEARLLIATVKQEQSDLWLATISRDEGSDEPSPDGRYEWLPLASALVEIRSNGDVPKAISELRAYCGLDRAGAPGRAAESESGLHERCLKAYALLVAERRTAEAESLLYDAYRAALSSRRINDATLAGLAELEAKRGRTEEASRLLRLLVGRSTEDLQALRVAAETAARINRFEEAASYRKQIAIANPDDATNVLELARLTGAAGNGSEAIALAIGLMEKRKTPNRVRAQAAEVIGQFVAADRSLASTSEAARLLQAAQGASAAPGAKLAAASILESSGRAGEAQALLAQVEGPLKAVAQLRLGRMAMDGGRQGDAVSSFERALFLDAGGEMAQAVAFRSPDARAQLILLYGRVGRDLAAVRLAESDDPEDHYSISRLLRMALARQDDTAPESQAVSFEPSIVEAISEPGLRTLAELNDSSARQTERLMLASLADSAARLGQFDKAVAIDRFRAAGATRAEERAAIEKRLAERMDAERARQIRAAALLRIDRRNTSDSVFTARVLGNR